MVYIFFMGLEDLVNLVLKPFEGVAQIVYDACFATDIKREVGKDGKVSYKVSYTNENPIRAIFDYGKKAYTTSKNFVQEKVVRRLDKGVVFLEKYDNEYLFHPILNFYDKNKAMSWCLGLGLIYLLI